MPLSPTVILEITGIPIEMAENFHRWGTAIDEHLRLRPRSDRSRRRRADELFAYTQQLIDAPRGESATPLDVDLDPAV